MTRHDMPPGAAASPPIRIFLVQPTSACVGLEDTDIKNRLPYVNAPMHGIRALTGATTARLLSCVAFVAMQAVAVTRCDACATPFSTRADACGACLADVADRAPENCPACVATASCGAHATEDQPAPCRCQWEPRDDAPLASPHGPAIDLLSPAPTPWLAHDAGHGVRDAFRVDAPDVPRRPVRILLGVWRN